MIPKIFAGKYIVGSMSKGYPGRRLGRFEERDGQAPWL
jgi:hypothetical protein